MGQPRRGARAVRRAQRATPSRARSGFPGSTLQRTIVAVVAIKIAAIVLAIAPAGLDPFTPPKVFASRMTEYALVGLLALAIARYGRNILPRSGIHAIVVAFAVANAISFAVAEDRYVALFGDAIRLEGATWIIDMLVLYAAVATGFRSLRDWTLLGLSVAGTTLVTLLYAVAQFMGVDPFPWGAEARIRPFATLGNANVLAHYLAIAVGAAMGCAIAWRGGVALAAAALLLPIVAVGALSGTRGLLLGLTGATLVALAVFIRVRGLSRSTFAPIAAGLAALVLATGLVVVATPTGQRTLGSFSGGALLQDRLIFYRDALAAAADRPMFGWGIENLHVATVGHRQPDEAAVLGPATVFTSAHDPFLQALVTTGIVGALAVLTIDLTLLVALWRLLPTAPRVAAPLLVATAAYLTEGLVSVGAVEVDWLPWVALGGAVALRADATPTGAPRRRPSVLTVATGALVVLMTALALPPYLANDAAGRALQLSASGRGTAGVTQGQASVDFDPGRARNWARLGKSLAAANRNKEAGNAFAEAARRMPYHYEYWNNLAVARALQASAGDVSDGGWPAAVASAREGLRRNPDNAILLYTLAYALDGSGDASGAMAAITRAITLYDRDPTYDVMAARASGRIPDAAAARRSLLDILAVKDSAVLRVAEARVELRLGEQGAAIAQLRHVLEKMDPNNRDALQLIRSISP